MLLIGDQSQSRGNFPWVTSVLIGLNVAIFFCQVSQDESLTLGLSMVPAEVTTGEDLTGTHYEKMTVLTETYYDGEGEYQEVYAEEDVPIEHYPGPFPIHLTLLTSMFLHGDLIHLLGNLWFLLLFGRNVEHALGHALYLAFYLFCGFVAGIAQVMVDPNSIIPCLGASGAISGVMGAYVAIYPLNRIKIWMGLVLGVVQVPALVVVGIWFLMQWLSAWIVMDAGISTGTAYMAHVGGFLGGVVFTWGMTAWVYYSEWNKPKEEEFAEVEVVADATEEEEILPVFDVDVSPPSTGGGRIRLESERYMSKR